MHFRIVKVSSSLFRTLPLDTNTSIVHCASIRHRQSPLERNKIRRTNQLTVNNVIYRLRIFISQTLIHFDVQFYFGSLTTKNPVLLTNIQFSFRFESVVFLMDQWILFPIITANRSDFPPLPVFIDAVCQRGVWWWSVIIRFLAERKLA